jgi:hypothetical protein
MNVSPWDQLSIHLLLHSNTTACPLHSPLFWFSLNCTGLNWKLIHSLIWRLSTHPRALKWKLTNSDSLLICSVLHWTKLNSTASLWELGNYFWASRFQVYSRATSVFIISWAVSWTIQTSWEVHTGSWCDPSHAQLPWQYQVQHFFSVRVFCGCTST